MSRLLHDLGNLIQVIGDNWRHTSEIADESLAGRNLPGLLINLLNLGFVEQVVCDELAPLSNSKWKATKEGKAFVRLISKKNENRNNHEKDAANNTHYPKIVMTLPTIMTRTFLRDHPNVTVTAEVLTTFFKNAEKEIYIFSPYIDSSISFLVQNVNPNVNIKIITTPYIGASDKEYPNAVLERLTQRRNTSVKYMREISGGIQLFQIHAKLIIVDNVLAYIGSVNLKETSIFHNLELGTVIEEQKTVIELNEIFTDIFNNYSQGKENLL